MVIKLVRAYTIKQGATTIWELWNGDTADPAIISAKSFLKHMI